MPSVLLSLLTNTLPGPSASEVTTLWRYTNLFIIIIIIISDWPTADHVRHFAATSFSLLQQLYTVDNGIFLYNWCEHRFVSELKK